MKSNFLADLWSKMLLYKTAVFRSLFIPQLPSQIESLFMEIKLDKLLYHLNIFILLEVNIKASKLASGIIKTQRNHFTWLYFPSAYFELLTLCEISDNNFEAVPDKSWPPFFEGILSYHSMHKMGLYWLCKLSLWMESLVEELFLFSCNENIEDCKFLIEFTDHKWFFFRVLLQQTMLFLAFDWQSLDTQCNIQSADAIKIWTL